MADPLSMDHHPRSLSPSVSTEHDRNPSTPHEFSLQRSFAEDSSHYLQGLNTSQQLGSSHSQASLQQQPSAPAAQSQPQDAINLFVRQLPLWVTDKHLRDTFERHGTVISASVMRHMNSGESKGHGFVMMDGPSATRVLQGSVAVPKELPEQATAESLELSLEQEGMVVLSVSKAKHTGANALITDRCRLFVSNIPSTMTAQAVRDYFTRFGKINDCVIQPQRQGGPAGTVIGFVEFDQAEAAATAIKDVHGTNPFSMTGPPLFVKLSETRDMRHQRQAQRENSQSYNGSTSIRSSSISQGAAPHSPILTAQAPAQFGMGNGPSSPTVITLGAAGTGAPVPGQSAGPMFQQPQAPQSLLHSPPLQHVVVGNNSGSGNYPTSPQTPLLGVPPPSPGGASMGIPQLSPGATPLQVFVMPMGGTPQNVSLAAPMNTSQSTTPTTTNLAHPSPTQAAGHAVTPPSYALHQQHQQHLPVNPLQLPGQPVVTVGPQAQLRPPFAVSNNGQQPLGQHLSQPQHLSSFSQSQGLSQGSSVTPIENSLSGIRMA